MRLYQCPSGTYAEAERPLWLLMENGKVLLSYVAVQIDAKDVEGVLMAERLLDWLRRSEAEGEASITDLAAVAEGTPYQLRVRHPKESTYPLIYFVDSTGKATHGVHAEAPEVYF